MTSEEYEIMLRNQVLEAQRALSLLAQFEAQQRTIEALKARIAELEKKEESDG